MELSGEYPVKRLCRIMDVNRSGFYKWRNRIYNPSEKLKARADNINLFRAYHNMYPSHGYRWLNAKIKLDLGVVMSDVYAHKCCKYASIVSIAKHYKYHKPGDDKKVYPNLLLAGLNINGPYECIVSDMTAFYLEGTYFELTLYMDLWNNEILTYSLSSQRGDRMTYINGIKDIIEIKKEHTALEMTLHTDQGSVYSSKSFNELLPAYNIIHSMSRAGTPTDNAAMESINGWIKAEIFADFHLTSKETVIQDIKDYIVFFNEKRPAYSLKYLTPKQYKDVYYQKQQTTNQTTVSTFR